MASWVGRFEPSLELGSLRGFVVVSSLDRGSLKALVLYYSSLIFPSLFYPRSPNALPFSLSYVPLTLSRAFILSLSPSSHG